MKMTKKCLALVMAVVMLVSVFAFSASALTYEPTMTTGDIKLIIRADKDVVNPGDEVKFSIYIDKASYGDFGPWMTTIVYNNTLINPISTTNTEFRQYTNECANFMKQTSTVNFNYPIAQLTALTTDEAAYYNKAIMMNGVVDTAQTTNAAGNGWTPADANTAQCEFTMKVADDAAPGSEIWVGNHQATYTKNVSYMSPAGSTRYANTVYDLSESMVKLTVASAAADPSVVKSAGQIKMTPTSATTVDDAFQLRIISKITSADWDANFANTAVDGATANYITKVGMVAYTGVADAYSLDDAKAAIAAGASSGDYYYGATDYISHTEGGDATFGTVLKCTHGGDKLQNDPICLGFVTYVDAAGQAQTIYYAETYTAPIVSNYDTLASSYASNFWGK